MSALPDEVVNEDEGDSLFEGRNSKTPNELNNNNHHDGGFSFRCTPRRVTLLLILVSIVAFITGSQTTSIRLLKTKLEADTARSDAMTKETSAPHLSKEDVIPPPIQSARLTPAPEHQPPQTQIPTQSPTSGVPAFVRSLRENVNWSLIDDDKADRTKILLQLENVMVDYILKEPSVPIDPKCGPDNSYLPITPEMCAKASTTAFTGTLRSTPAKVGILIQFGWDIDTLEAYLSEVYDIVDNFFVIESSQTHLKGLRKPLVWQVLSTKPRFKRFVEKVVGFTLDDADSLHKDGMWGLESRQELDRWEKFKKWNDYHKVFGNDDILGFGDADEVPSRYNIQLLKYCETRRTPIDVGIAFTMSHLDWMFKTDWPASPSYPYALGDPSFYTLRDASQVKSYPNRGRGRNQNFVLGGVHLTAYTYVPFYFLKMLSCTECNSFNINQLREWRRWTDSGNVNTFENWAQRDQEHWRSRVTMYNNLDRNQQATRVLPWLMKCNPDRFPAWTWKSDLRLYH